MRGGHHSHKAGQNQTPPLASLPEAAAPQALCPLPHRLPLEAAVCPDGVGVDNISSGQESWGNSTTTTGEVCSRAVPAGEDPPSGTDPTDGQAPHSLPGALLPASRSPSTILCGQRWTTLAAGHMQVVASARGGVPPTRRGPAAPREGPWCARRGPWSTNPARETRPPKQAG